jgi:hypothetical protein
MRMAEMLGMSVDHFNRTRAKLHAKGMPPTVTPHGKVRINRELFDEWLKRRTAPPVLAPANDDQEAQDARDRLRRAYALARL